MAIPAIPQNFYIQQGNGSVFICWDLVAGATSYSVKRSTDGVTYSVLTSPSVNSYLDTSVTVGTLYYYKVASTNSSGTSSYSSPASIVPALAGQISLGELRLLSQQRADRVGSNFVTLPEWNNFINQSAQELYNILVTTYEDYFQAASVTLTTDGINNQYALPNGSNYSSAAAFYKLTGVDCGLGGSTNAWSTLKKFDFIARNRYVYPQMNASLLGVFNMQYRVLGSNIQFIPTPSANMSIRLWYIPRLRKLLQDTDILDGISGWSQYVIVRSAKYALDKEESDTSKLDEVLIFLKGQIEEAASNRDAGQPDTISATRINSFSGADIPDGPWGGN